MADKHFFPCFAYPRGSPTTVLRTVNTRHLDFDTRVHGFGTKVYFNLKNFNTRFYKKTRAREIANTLVQTHVFDNEVRCYDYSVDLYELKCIKIYHIMCSENYEHIH